MKIKQGLYRVASNLLLHIIFIVLCKYKEGRRRVCRNCQLPYTLVGRPQQPHEKHDNTSLIHETSQIRLASLSMALGGTSSVFTVRTTPPHQKVSQKLTHVITPFCPFRHRVDGEAYASLSYIYMKCQRAILFLLFSICRYILCVTPSSAAGPEAYD